MCKIWLTRDDQACLVHYKWSESVAYNIAFQAHYTPRRNNLRTEVLLWKRMKYFPSTLRRPWLINASMTVILDLCLRKTRSRKSRDYRDVIVFSKCFPSTRKRKVGVFKFLPFRKAPFLWRICVDRTPNRRSKAAFSNFYGAELAQPQ